MIQDFLKLKMFSQEDKNKLKELIAIDYNEEQLTDFISRSIAEQGLLILSQDYKNKDDPMFIKREFMINTLKELREIAVIRLNKISKKKKR